jgi:hypothetical protein
MEKKPFRSWGGDHDTYTLSWAAEYWTECRYPSDGRLGHQI